MTTAIRTLFNPPAPSAEALEKVPEHTVKNYALSAIPVVGNIASSFYIDQINQRLKMEKEIQQVDALAYTHNRFLAVDFLRQVLEIATLAGIVATVDMKSWKAAFLHVLVGMRLSNMAGTYTVLSEYEAQRDLIRTALETKQP